MESSPYVFRPINDSPDIIIRNSVTSPVRQAKLYGCWRNNPEIRSNSRHSTTSRPGSSATNSRPPSSNIYYPLSSSTNNSSSTLYCKSSNNSLTDVIVSRNFQQLSVSNRRAAFKGYEIQKWSSFDGKKRRPQNSLDSENTGSSLDLKFEERNIVSPVEIARRELHELLRNQQGEGNSVQKSTSLPSFPESFNGFLGKGSTEKSIDEELDDEIKMIVAKAEKVKEEEESFKKVTRNQEKHQLNHRKALSLFLSVTAQGGIDVTEDNSEDGATDDLLREQDPNIINPQNKQGYGRDIPLQVTETKPLKVEKKDSKKSILDQTIQAILQFGVLVAVAFMVGFLFMLNIGVELAYEKIKERVSNLCCSKRTIGGDEPDPAQLVGTFKRYK